MMRQSRNQRLKESPGKRCGVQCTGGGKNTSPGQVGVRWSVALTFQETWPSLAPSTLAFCAFLPLGGGGGPKNESYGDTLLKSAVASFLLVWTFLSRLLTVGVAWTGGLHWSPAVGLVAHPLSSIPPSLCFSLLLFILLNCVSECVWGCLVLECLSFAVKFCVHMY